MIDYVKRPAPAPAVTLYIGTLEQEAGDAILTALDAAFAAGQASAQRGRKGALAYAKANAASADANTKMWRAFYALVQQD
jgi:hypothetical protein